MNTELTNRVTMIKTTSAYMAEHSAIWNTMAPLQTAMTELDAKIAGHQKGIEWDRNRFSFGNLREDNQGQDQRTEHGRNGHPMRPVPDPMACQTDDQEGSERQ